MASPYKYDFGSWESYRDYPCPNYDVPHFMRDCNYAPWRERWNHHLNPIGSIGAHYVAVEMDIGMIVQMLPPLLY